MGRCGWPNYLQEPWHPSPCGNSSPHLQSRPDGSFQPHAHGSVAPGQLLRMILAASYILIHSRVEQVSCSLHQALEQCYTRYEGNVESRHYYYSANLATTKVDLNLKILSSVTYSPNPLTLSPSRRDDIQGHPANKITNALKDNKTPHKSYSGSPHEPGRAPETRTTEATYGYTGTPDPCVYPSCPSPQGKLSCAGQTCPP